MPDDEFHRADAHGVVTPTFTRDRELNAVTAGMPDAVQTAVADLADPAATCGYW